VAGYERLSRDELLRALAERDRLIGELREKVARLERLVSRNSGNSSMAPSAGDLPGGFLSALRRRGKAEAG